MTQIDHGLEAITLAHFLWDTLTEDPDLQALAGSADALKGRVIESATLGPSPWWITFTMLPPVDVKTVGLIPVMASVQAQVKVVGPTKSYAPLVPVYRRVHALLEGRTIPVEAGAGTVLTMGRVSGIQFPEQANGIEYRHLGGLYEALTQ